MIVSLKGRVSLADYLASKCRHPCYELHTVFTLKILLSQNEYLLQTKTTLTDDLKAERYEILFKSFNLKLGPKKTEVGCFHLNNTI